MRHADHARRSEGCRAATLAWLAVLGGLVAVAPLVAAEPGRWTLSVELSGRRIEGTPLRYDERHVDLLGRDGRLWSFAPGEAQKFHKASDAFRGYSSAELRDQLVRELGQEFEVLGSGHYLVAFPRGQRNEWATRFEEMYRAFVHYVSIRGFRPVEPEFPLVAIVWPTREQFLRYAASEGVSTGGNYAGFYFGRSNRVALFDQGGSGSGAVDAARNLELIVHEVTHQTAYNTGVHRRFAATPRWLAEGLATMFEARGVWNARQYPQAADRVNRGQLRAFRAYQSRRPTDALATLVSSDRAFDLDTDAAYAEAWALTYYLAEKRPQQYAQYLSRVAAKPAFRSVPAAERLSDFQAAFGPNLKLLDAQYLKFIAELR